MVHLKQFKMLWKKFPEMLKENLSSSQKMLSVGGLIVTAVTASAKREIEDSEKTLAIKKG